MPQQHGAVRTAQCPGGEGGCDSRSTTCKVGRGTQELGGSPNEKSQTQNIVQSPPLVPQEKGLDHKIWNSKGQPNSLSPFSLSLCGQPSALWEELHRWRKLGMLYEGTWEEKNYFLQPQCAQINPVHSTKSLTEDLKSSHLQNNKIHPLFFFLKDQGTDHFRSSKAVSSSVKNMFLSHIGPEGIQSVSMCTSYQSHAEISTDVVQRDVTPSTFTVRSDCSAAKANTDLTKQKKIMTFSSHQKRLVRRDHSPQMLHDCGREMS